MTAPPVGCLALDVGTATAKLAVDGPSERVVSSPVPAGDWRAFLSGALAAAELALPGDGICLAVPEAWLDGSVEGTTAQEALRQACEDLGIARVIWTSQLAAVAALTARPSASGRYLVADVGATGVRAAVIEAAPPVVRIAAAASADGGGLRDFDAAVRALLPGGEHLPPDWHRSLAGQERRARAVLPRATAAPAYRDAPVYELSGCELLAGQLIDCFAPTGQRLRAMATRVLQDGPVDAAVLTGGLSWFPLAQVIIGEIAGVDPVAQTPDAAARGALLFARGTVRLAPPTDLAAVTVPARRIANGELEEVSLTLPWTEPFASPADGPLIIETPELTVDVAGRRVIAGLPGLVPGPCLVGVRAGWSGSIALVVRPADGGGSPVVASLTP